MKKSKSSLLWVYLFPALMDLSVSAVLIFSSIKAVELKANPVMVGILGSVWGITYFFSSLFLSRIITKKNSVNFMLLSCAGFVFIGLIFSLFTTFSSLFVLLFIGGLFSAFFFIGFQLFMEHTTLLPAFRASAFYTLSWSTGMAVGSISEGFLMSKGVIGSLLPILLPALFIISGIFLSRKITANNNNFSPEIFQDYIDESVVRLYRKIAWIEIFTVTFVTGGIRYLLPKMTISFFNFSSSLAAISVFLFFISQAISGYFCSFFKNLSYNLKIHDYMKLIAGLSLLMILALPFSFTIFLFVFIFGIYSGHAFYNAVFYAINHKEQAGFNVGINESLVGIASIAGPFLFGIMLNFGLKHFLIFPCFVLIICSIYQHLISKPKQYLK